MIFKQTNNLNSQIHPKIAAFIENIPENGAVCVSEDSWSTQTGKPRKVIAKINGRIEWIERNDTDWETVYVWYYDIFPEIQNEHFDVENMPKIIKKIYEVFI
jgi:uncharacterized protein (UPF0335 family)